MMGEDNDGELGRGLLIERRAGAPSSNWSSRLLKGAACQLCTSEVVGSNLALGPVRRAMHPATWQWSRVAEAVQPEGRIAAAAVMGVQQQDEHLGH